MIPDDIVERVREQADIVSIVGEIVKLKRVGNSFRGPCPFHQGKDPNFSVSPRGGYVCFVCHEKGDVFTFVQKRLGLDFVEAVKYVGAKAGVDVKEVSRTQTQGPDPRERYWEINAAAAEYFTKTLWETDLGAPAREYLAMRQWDKAASDRFGLGFAPRDAALMRAHLATLGFDDARQIEAGLLHVREDETEIRTRFRNRLMFPIYDTQSRVIAFGGRVIGEGEPKYLNSAESGVFVKGATLYGLNWAKNAIRKDERALLVEGYFDCIRLMAAGVESVVAPLGTALTEAQAELIRKYTNTVFLLYDSDQAGLKATFRAGDILLKLGFKVHVVTLPEGDDPDSFVQSHGRDKLEGQLGVAMDLFERKIQILERGGWFTDLRRKRVALDRLLPTLRVASDPITRGLYLARAAEAVGVSEAVLERELKQSPGRPGARRLPGAESAPPHPDEPPPIDPREAAATLARRLEAVPAERELLRVLLHKRHFIEQAAEDVGPESFREPILGSIFNHLVAAPDDSIESMVTVMDDDAVAVLNALSENDGGLDVAARIVQDCVLALRRQGLTDEIVQVGRDLELAGESEKDKLVRRKQQLAMELKALGGKRWPSFGPRN